MENISTAELIIRVVVIIILAGLIGFERETIKTPAGLRTNILVGLGSTLIMVLSIMLAAESTSTEIDPGRIAGQVITGIGFLGAGAIIQSRGSIRGLTSAATIWVVAAIGLVVGAGYYLIAVIATVAVLITLHILPNLERRFDKGKDNQ
ncbi:MgtC/SapB family protein [Patescibacteria group bacterium]